MHRPSLPERKAEFIEPMEGAPVAKLPDSSQWAYEIELDGYRAVALKSERMTLCSSDPKERAGEA